MLTLGAQIYILRVGLGRELLEPLLFTVEIHIGQQVEVLFSLQPLLFPLKLYYLLLKQLFL